MLQIRLSQLNTKTSSWQNLGHYEVNYSLIGIYLASHGDYENIFNRETTLQTLKAPFSSPGLCIHPGLFPRAQKQAEYLIIKPIIFNYYGNNGCDVMTQL